MTRRPKPCWPFSNVSTFGRSELGGLTATMVLSSTLLVVALGATVDFGRYVSARTALQAAIDGAALQAAIDGAALQGATSALTGDELTALVQQSVTQNFNSEDYGAIAVTASITDFDTLLVEAKLTFETDFIRNSGQRKIRRQRRGRGYSSAKNEQVDRGRPRCRCILYVPNALHPPGDAGFAQLLCNNTG